MVEKKESLGCGVGVAWRVRGCGRLCAVVVVAVVVCRVEKVRLLQGSGGEDRVTLWEGWKRKTGVRGGIAWEVVRGGKRGEGEIGGMAERKTEQAESSGVIGRSKSRLLS